MSHGSLVNDMNPNRLSHLLFALMVTLAVIAGAACAPEEEPFPFEYHGTPTPTPVPIANATPEKIITHKYDIISKGETIKIAEWDDNTLKMLNFLAGYVIIFGFDHAVELVDLGEKHYGDALLAGRRSYRSLDGRELAQLHGRRRGHSRSRHAVRGRIRSAYRGQSCP